MPALAVLVLVTAVWGVTFVQVKDAVSVYPLFAFLALRFATRDRRARAAGGGARAEPRPGVAAAALAGALLASGYTFQTAGLERTSVSSAGFVTGTYVVLTLVLAGAAVYALQIVLMERYAPRYDPFAFTLVEMAVSFAGLAVLAGGLGQVAVPRGWTVWGALLVTGVFTGRARVPRADVGSSSGRAPPAPPSSSRSSPSGRRSSA